MEYFFRQNLKDELSYQGITIKELSDKTDIPLRTIENYLNCRGTIPPVDKAYKIAKTLGVSIEWLLNDHERLPTNQVENKKYAPLLRDIKKLPEKMQDAVIQLVEIASETRE